LKVFRRTLFFALCAGILAGLFWLLFNRHIGHAPISMSDKNFALAGVVSTLGMFVWCAVFGRSEMRLGIGGLILATVTIFLDLTVAST
jgi:hypothetical protein